jgi:dihydropteroate synthase
MTGAMGRVSGDHKLVANRVLLMGIVNVTPDSFSDGGTYAGVSEGFEHALKLAGEGADILDIGGESTRPGADPVSIDEELQRVIPVLKALKSWKTDNPSFSARISIDTRKAEVMRQALAAGADLINDVTALQYDEDSMKIAADCDCPVILMHGKGDPKTMQDSPFYQNVVVEVFEYLAERISLCEKAGIDRTRLIADPGIGFGKTVAHNLSLLAHLERFHDLDVPLLLGASRKRFIGSLSGQDDPLKRASGSIAAALLAVSKGVQILRVHDVAKTRQALDVWQAIATAKDRAL